MPVPKGGGRAFQTELIHAGEPRPRVEGAGVLPIFRSTLWEDDADAGYHEIRYPRLSNLPNHMALGAKLAALEGGEAGLIAGSGMAAISSALLSLLGAGDHVLVPEIVYGGTHALITRDLVALGVAFDFVDPQDPEDWKAKLRPETRAFHVETMANPLLEVPDLEAVVAFARDHGLTTTIDNTFASPFNFRPLEHGFDLVLHSATKYLNGHSDVVGGCVVGSAERVLAAKHKLDHFGGSLDPQGVYLLNRGVKTLALRVAQQNHSAQAIAEFLEGHAAVERVRYPGLASHPQHDRSRRLFDGCGGMLCFELADGEAAAKRLIERVELAMPTASLGGVETVLTRPAATSHSGLSPEERAHAGISNGLIRFSVGIEATEDLIADLERALA